MINQLLPDQIASMWDVLAYGIERALPPVVDAPDRIGRLLAALLSGKMQCWVTSSRENGRVRLEAVVITQIVEDEGSGTRSLLIYALYGYRPISTWSEGFETLSKWARLQKCTRMTAFTNSPQVVEMVKKFGGSADYVYASIPLNGSSVKVSRQSKED